MDPDALPVDEWQAKMVQYADFLSARRSSIPKKLWRFFRHDFFHDGGFEDFGWDGLPGSFSMQLNCPNIKFISGGAHDGRSFDRTADYAYVNASFICSFQAVHHFAIRAYELDESEPYHDPSEISFVGAKIEAEQELIAAAKLETGEEHHSIVIDCWQCAMTIVFQYCDVEPVESLAFAALLDDPRFQIPFAE